MGRRFVRWTSLAILWALATAPLWLVGFPRGHDWLFELVRVAQTGAALQDGPIPAAWAPDLYAGFGSPIFLFYAPLFGHLAWLLSLAAGSIHGGVVATRALAAGVGAAAGLLLVRASGRGPSSAAGATQERVTVALFLLHPYVVADLAIRNACAEYLALMLLPLPLAGAVLCRSGSAWGGPLVAGGLALVVLAHNLTALMAVVLLSVLILDLYRRPAMLLRGSAGVVLGLALAAWFWLPALTLLPKVRSVELTEGKFRVVENLPAWTEIPGGKFFSVGWLTLAVLVAGAGTAALRRRARSPATRWLPIAAASALLFMVTPLSAPLWRGIGALALFQFPWRLVGPLALLAAWIGGGLAGRLTAAWSPGKRTALELAVLAIALVQLWPVLSRVRPLEADVRAELGTLLERESVRRRSLPATVGHEYLPRGAHAGAMQRPRWGPLLGDAPGPRVRVEAVDGTTLHMENLSAASAGVEIARWAFPGWRAWRASGGAVPVGTGADGTLRATLPPAPSSVVVEYRSPSARRWGLAVSGLAALAWLGWCRRIARRPRQREAPT